MPRRLLLYNYICLYIASSGHVHGALLGRGDLPLILRPLTKIPKIQGTIYLDVEWPTTYNI